MTRLRSANPIKGKFDNVQAPSPTNEEPIEPFSKKNTFLGSLKWQILSIALVSVVGFLIYIAVIVYESNQTARLLKELENRRYPVQAHLLTALHNLEFMYYLMETSVITGDPESLSETMNIAASFRMELTKAGAASPQQKVTIDQLLDEFEQYFIKAHSLALDMMDPYVDPIQFVDRGKESTAAYESVRAALKIFQKQQNKAFTTSISNATNRANRFVLLGYSTGVLTALLVFIIAVVTSRGILRRINHMVTTLRRIAQENGDMSVRIPLSGNDEMTELAYWFNSFIVKLQRITQKSTAEIKRIAYSDHLSGLPNRHMLIERLEQEIKHAEEIDSNVAVIMLDLDNFKPVNDRFGHDAGDLLIKAVSKRLTDLFSNDDQSQLKSFVDTSIGEQIVGRLGGDEFMAILPFYRSDRELTELALKICGELSKPFNILNNQCIIGVSVGVSRFPTDCDSSLELMAFADMAMYEAKSGNKNEYRFFEKAIAETRNLNNRVSIALESAIENNEFSMVYQPKFCLSDGSYVGAEALLRWNHPELGTIGPDIFIPIAIKRGKIIDIDQWVIGAVCRQIHNWHNNGLDPLRVAINVSPQQIWRDDFVRSLTQIADSCSTDLASLEVEITETSALDHLDVVSRNLEAVRDLGVTVAMDDFGAGHSSLLLLMDIQIDVLKMDRSLIQRIEHDSVSRSLVSSMVSLANELNIKIVAEGIERIEQAALLYSLNCDFGQGYFYSMPISADELHDNIRNGFEQVIPRAS